ncbi:hypothetical protein DFH06DRAFT_1483658 [Mycena polygramma]|nr:hypothetical protein DFH06DRAFT_1483658 [Mycena polygramma]
MRLPPPRCTSRHRALPERGTAFGPLVQSITARSIRRTHSNGSCLSMPQLATQRGGSEDPVAHTYTICAPADPTRADRAHSESLNMLGPHGSAQSSRLLVHTPPCTILVMPTILTLSVGLGGYTALTSVVSVMKACNLGQLRLGRLRYMITEMLWICSSHPSKERERTQSVRVQRDSVQQSPPIHVSHLSSGTRSHFRTLRPPQAIRFLPIVVNTLPEFPYKRIMNVRGNRGCGERDYLREIIHTNRYRTRAATGVPSSGRIPDPTYRAPLRLLLRRPRPRPVALCASSLPDSETDVHTGTLLSLVDILLSASADPRRCTPPAHPRRRRTRVQRCLRALRTRSSSSPDSACNFDDRSDAGFHGAAPHGGGDAGRLAHDGAHDVAWRSGNGALMSRSEAGKDLRFAKRVWRFVARKSFA